MTGIQYLVLYHLEHDRLVRRETRSVTPSVTQHVYLLPESRIPCYLATTTLGMWRVLFAHHGIHWVRIDKHG